MVLEFKFVPDPSQNRFQDASDLKQWFGSLHERWEAELGMFCLVLHEAGESMLCLVLHEVSILEPDQIAK